MIHDSKFGPAAQTPEQRLWVLRQMQLVIPALRKKVPAVAQQFYDRYIAGELSWQQMRHELDAAAPNHAGS
ncbi:MAG: hypothetical protein EOO62_03060 [Hymenobacter sp.]|nr:MAG: hypothetical protein EOO62_03060 [Hymenobacter sp.]